MAGLSRRDFGTERLVWLASYNSAVATLRLVGVLPALMFVGGTPQVFSSVAGSGIRTNWAGRQSV
jgi:hypothetical protein